MDPTCSKILDEAGKYLHPDMHKPAYPPQQVGDDSGPRPVSLGKIGKKTISRVKQANFTAQEDVNILKCWLAMRCDPIIDNYQKKGSFWRRVLELYNKNRGNYPERSIRSLGCRWDVIKTQSSTFAGYMSNVLHENQSGMSDADKTSIAASRFAVAEHHPYLFLHCWNILKDERKWMDKDDDVVPHNSKTVDLDPYMPSPIQSTCKRPLGRGDSSKESRKKASLGTYSDQGSKYHELTIEKLSLFKDAFGKRDNGLEILVDMEKKVDNYEQYRAEQIALDKERVNIEKERHIRDMAAEEERILAIDLDKCNPAQRKYYKAKQDQILAKIGGDE